MTSSKLDLPALPSSLWLDNSGSYEPNSSLVGDKHVDVAIIGGGYAGLVTAYELKRAEPTMRVSVLEAKSVGYGASGRNGSFAMTVVGLGFGVMAMLRGKEFVHDAHLYMMKAVDGLDELIQREKLDCDRSRPGFLRVATTPGYAKKIRHDVELMNSLGFDDIYWIDEQETQSRVHSPRYLGAMWEPRLVLVNPLKLVRAEKQMAERCGVTVYEETHVLEVTRGTNFLLKTPGGQLTAEKIFFATNAYSHLFDKVRRKQIPAFTYMIATEPLTDDQMTTIGWQGREGLEDARNLVHYYRLTPDKRLVMGGGPIGLTFANRLDRDRDQAAWRHLEEHITFLFPSLEGIRIAHRWGGPFSVTVDLTPAIGYVGDRRAVYSLGCIGHGLSMSHLNAQTIRDILLERQSELLDCPFVDRRVLPWPPEPFRSLIAGGLRAYLRLEDWAYERKHKENK